MTIDEIFGKKENEMIQRYVNKLMETVEPELKELIAIVKDRATGEKRVLKETSYNTKKDFKQDIKDNGYILVNNYIFTADQWNSESFMNEFNEKKETRNLINKYVRNCRK